MKRALLIEIRRSPLRWIAPALLAMDLGMLFGRDTLWIGVWPQASAAAQLPAWFFAPVLAAGAAWSAGRTSRADGADQFSAVARPAWQREAVHLTATLGYGLTPLLVGAVVAAAVSAPEAGSGFLWPSYLLLAASLICMCAALGHLAGRLSRSRFAPPFVAGVVVFGLTWFNPLPSLSFHVLSGPPQLEITTGALLARIALACAVVAAAVLIGPTTQREWRPAYRLNAVAPVAAIVLVLLSGIGVAAAGPLRAHRNPPDSPLCSSGDPRVCVWPEHRKYLAPLTAKVERFEAIAEADLFVLPDTFYENGLRGSVQDTSNGFELALAGEWLAIRGMVSSAMNATFNDDFCEPATAAADERRFTAQTELKEWLVAYVFGGAKPPYYLGGYAEQEAIAVEVLKLSEPEQFAWAEQRVTAIRDTPCAG